ncbi:MAG TPA: ParB/RepB/Spo0J family partition protein, partial [Phenylobacterium sp.]|nr:ParB/RepB/Spo0J family partition protein [Phenylobacterium sp.]
MTTRTETVIESGVEIDVQLNRLKKSPKNARKVPHSEAAIEALAASIGAKRMLQPLVVEPEVDGEGQPTGAYFVTIGEGRRLAQRLRAKRGEIRKTAPIRCVVETALDAGEISLDENVTRSAMHPADEFEAFRELAERRGLGPEEIGARFGVSAEVVKRRLRLGAVSPKLLAAYRQGELTLDQVMAFAVSEDHARQEQVFGQLAAAGRSPHHIRRAMTEAKVPVGDRRAVFVGVEAYAEAGGTILRDLFTEDGGGWLEDVPLLDRLVAEKLDGLAREVREAEGWKWAEAHLDYPHGHACSRVYPSPVERTEAEAAEITAISDEYDALTQQWADVEDLPSEVEARLAEIDAMLEAYGDGYAYDPAEVARGGVFVVLGYDGTARVERGLIRPEDLPPPDSKSGAEPGVGDGEGAPAVGGRDPEETEADEDDGGLAPLSDRLVADLTAHRTLALRDALADDPDAALLVVVHAAVLRTFYPGCAATCADVRFVSASLAREAEGIEDTKAARRIAERHEAWAKQMPQEAADAWAFVVALDGDSRAALLAHCVGLTVNAVHGWERRPQAWAHADALAAAISLDMTAYWTPTARSYFGRVTKARIAEAVGEAVSADAAERIGGLKKPEMAEAAEQLVAATGWLPPLLRTASA